MEDDYTTTTPVILIGVEKKRLKGFSEVVLETEGGRRQTFRGVISVEMDNGTLIITIESEGDIEDVPPFDTSGER